MTIVVVESAFLPDSSLNMTIIPRISRCSSSSALSLGVLNELSVYSRYTAFLYFEPMNVLPLLKNGSPGLWKIEDQFEDTVSPSFFCISLASFDPSVDIPAQLSKIKQYFQYTLDPWVNIKPLQKKQNHCRTHKGCSTQATNRHCLCCDTKRFN